MTSPLLLSFYLLCILIASYSKSVKLVCPKGYILSGNSVIWIHQETGGDNDTTIEINDTEAFSKCIVCASTTKPGKSVEVCHQYGLFDEIERRPEPWRSTKATKRQFESLHIKTMDDTLFKFYRSTLH